MLYETLERRAYLSVSLVGTKLQIVGTTNNDVALVSQVGASVIRVVLNGASFQFNDINVATILMNGLAGNDKLEVQAGSGANSLTEPVTVNGGDGNDSIRGGAGPDVLNGDDGQNLIEGSGGNDKLSADGLINSFVGGDGNDTMHGGGKFDTYDGGPGSDTVDYSDRALAVSVTLDNLANDGGQSLLPRFAEGDNVKDSVENVNGGAANDIIIASISVSAANTFNGNGGNDQLFGLAGNDKLNLGTGNDAGLGGDGNDTVAGNDGDDLILGEAGNDSLTGGKGNDFLDGGNGVDKIFGDEGSDVVIAKDTTADATLDAGPAADFLSFDVLVRDPSDTSIVGSFDLLV